MPAAPAKSHGQAQRRRGPLHRLALGRRGQAAPARRYPCVPAALGSLGTTVAHGQAEQAWPSGRSRGRTTRSACSSPACPTSASRASSTPCAASASRKVGLHALSPFWATQGSPYPSLRRQSRLDVLRARPHPPPLDRHQDRDVPAGLHLRHAGHHGALPRTRCRRAGSGTQARADGRDQGESVREGGPQRVLAVAVEDTGRDARRRLA